MKPESLSAIRKVRYLSGAWGSYTQQIFCDRRVLHIFTAQEIAKWFNERRKVTFVIAAWAVPCNVKWACCTCTYCVHSKLGATGMIHAWACLARC